MILKIEDCFEEIIRKIKYSYWEDVNEKKMKLQRA